MSKFWQKFLDEQAPVCPPARRSGKTEALRSAAVKDIEESLLTDVRHGCSKPAETVAGQLDTPAGRRKYYGIDPLSGDPDEPKPTRFLCMGCKGTGGDETGTCRRCKGAGFSEWGEPTPPEHYESEMKPIRGNHVSLDVGQRVLQGEWKRGYLLQGEWKRGYLK